ncbi:l-ascorbate oxidase [Trichoderma arundinaceum]|uniref:L-ascorbate oxidase n=1 Tax=Trichoderma arundinaceum TaxID=490622 RepID=A0A395N9I4_TRIAR|nr:l-ascorbate oxidase [Trichoderma arundinaceum]
MRWLLLNSLRFLSLLELAQAALTPQIHDNSFIPDRVLRVTRRDVGVGGIIRYTTLVNDTLPGPELHIPEGRVVWIRVYNDMTDANLTMHWHGLAQAAAPFSDGTPMASQWPIPPQHYFDYELKTPRGTAGTYFYHSHVDFQTSTANGPLIVDDSGLSPYPVHGDRIIHISELFNKTDKVISDGLRATPFVWSGETGGFLINGNTISNYDIVDPASAKLSVIDVDPGKTYRFRYVGATSLSFASLAFENHTDLRVIEADGGYTRPHSTPLLQVGSGQRFSTLFKTKTCAELEKLGKLDFYLQIETRDRPTVVTSYAVLRYRNSCSCFRGRREEDLRVSTTALPSKKAVDLPPTIEGFLDYKLEPLFPNDFPSSAEVSRRVFIYAQQLVNKYVLWTDNDVSWSADGVGNLPHQTTPSEPYLVSLYKNASRYLPNYEASVANYGLDPQTKTYPAKLGEIIEVVFQQVGSHTLDGSKGGGLDSHPWHAHGKHIYDIGGGPGVYDPEVAQQRLHGTHPIQRDTTMLYRYNASVLPDQPWGWRAWRIRVQDPGVWMIHCHTLQHMVMGMQTVWVFGDAGDILKAKYPDVTGYLVYGGNVNGNATHHAEAIHYYDEEKED